MTAVFFGIVLLADLLAVVLQSDLQPMPRFMEARVMVYPVLLVYGALALPFVGTLALAFCHGLFWAALYAPIVNPDALAQQQAVVEIPLGWFIVLYGALAVLVHGLRPLFLRGRWDVFCLASGFCTVIIVFAEYLMITFQRFQDNGFAFPREIWARILLPGFFSMLLSVAVYFLFNLLAALVNYPVRLKEERAL